MRVVDQTFGSFDHAACAYGIPPRPSTPGGCGETVTGNVTASKCPPASQPKSVVHPPSTPRRELWTSRRASVSDLLTRRDVPDIAGGLLLTGLPAACEGGTPPVSLSDAKPPADAAAASEGIVQRVPMSGGLRPGWYALLLGTGAVGAPLSSASLVAMPRPGCVSLPPPAPPFSMRQSDGRRLLEGVSAHVFGRVRGGPQRVRGAARGGLGDAAGRLLGAGTRPIRRSPARSRAQTRSASCSKRGWSAGSICQ